MRWEAGPFQFPPSGQQVLDQVAPVLSGASVELSAAQNRLESIGASFVTNPLALIADKAQQAREQLRGLLNVKGQVLCVHPFLEGIGQGQGRYQYLSAPNLVQCLAEKLQDKHDEGRPVGPCDALCILVTATEYGRFSEALGSFNQVFPVPELQLAERRAGQLAVLESEKTIQPNAALNPHWKDRDHGQYPLAQEIRRGIGAQVGLMESFDAENQTPIDELQQLIAKKQRWLQQQEDNITALKARCSGPAGFRLFLENQSPSGIAKALQAPGLPGHENVLAAGVLLVTEPGGLTLFKEVLGL
ncbi:hypothetical protein [Hahella ganghwensis]|uniref:hypothetical protein n=1 Tax=Hahella ganghwensis TaxID=286420 RepID=UPI0003643AB7|nr:hypothetical protein [Hahella ganghwensis]